MPIGYYENPEIQRLGLNRLGPRAGEHPDRLIARIAELQAGQVHRHQLLALGLEPGAIEHRLKAGRLHRRRWSVYGVGHPRDDRLAEWHAAVLSSGDRAVLSHRAGGAHLGICPFAGGAIEITVPRQRQRMDGIRHVCRELPSDEVVVVDDLPVTSPVRTLFDLAGILPEYLFGRAVKEVEVQGMTDHLSLADLLRRHPRPPGASALRAIVEGRGLPATVIPTDGEDRFKRLIAQQPGIPAPAHRYGIALSDGWVEVDFAWPQLRIVVEVDSSYHEVDTALETDHDRDQALIAAGWWVFRVTWRQLRYDPQRVLRRLRPLLERAAADRSRRGP